MKTRLVALAVCALALLPLSMASAQDLPSAQSIVDKYVAAIGGKDTVAGIKNMVTKGNIMIVAMGMSATSTTHVELPNAKAVMSIEGFGEFLSGIKDGTPWSSNMMEGDKLLEGAEAKASMAQSDPQMWLNWKTYYASAETVAEEAVGEATALKVAFTPEEGQAMNYWFDKESGLIIQSEGPGLGGGISTNTLGDYKDVGGVLVAHAITSEGGQGAIEITMESIEHNATIDSSVFDVPETIAALMSGGGEEEGSDDKEEASGN